MEKFALIAMLILRLVGWLDSLGVLGENIYSCLLNRNMGRES